jgi:gamma-glutamylcyclotransferase (GGCT)/AIG2-like uncharacterized protein YtfP
MNLFAYGTLMFPEIWERVVGGEFRHEPATVHGFSVYRAAGQVFPVMVAAGENDTVAGIVIYHLTAADLAALDDYESDIYERIDVAAVLTDGRVEGAQAYLLPDAMRYLASREPWTAAWFRREAMAAYRKQCGW